MWRLLSSRAVRRSATVETRPQPGASGGRGGGAGDGGGKGGAGADGGDLEQRAPHIPQSQS